GFRVARMNDAPVQVNVHFVESGNLPTGVGEPGVPPVIAALANAIYSATGKRLRQMPFSKTKLVYCMRIRAPLLTLTLGATVSAGAAQTPKPMTLTALDYIEIEQLVAKYSRALDTCANNGYDYADLFTADGVFAATINGKPGPRFEGRERLAEASGGGKL